MLVRATRHFVHGAAAKLILPLVGYYYIITSRRRTNPDKNRSTGLSSIAPDCRGRFNRREFGTSIFVRILSGLQPLARGRRVAGAKRWLKITFARP